MKTRTNQPIELMSTANIEKLDDKFLNQLKAGDIITKQTGKMKHTYIVSYKEEKHGICITYVACGYMETISYDYTNGHWVFNSKDVLEVPTQSGTKLYQHMIYDNDEAYYILIVSTKSTHYTLDELKSSLHLGDNGVISLSYGNDISGSITLLWKLAINENVEDNFEGYVSGDDTAGIDRGTFLDLEYDYSMEEL